MFRWLLLVCACLCSFCHYCAPIIITVITNMANRVWCTSPHPFSPSNFQFLLPSIAYSCSKNKTISNKSSGRGSSLSSYAVNLKGQMKWWTLWPLFCVCWLFMGWLQLQFKACVLVLSQRHFGNLRILNSWIMTNWNFAIFFIVDRALVTILSLHCLVALIETLTKEYFRIDKIYVLFRRIKRLGCIRYKTNRVSWESWKVRKWFWLVWNIFIFKQYV